MTWMKQSMEPLYLAPPPEVIIILLLTVSEDQHVRNRFCNSVTRKDIQFIYFGPNKNGTSLTNGVRHESSSDGDSPSQEEGEEDSSVLAEQQRLQSVVEAEVHATVDEDANCGDGEASVQALDAIGLQSLHVHVDQAVELALTTLALGVVGQPENCS